MRVMVKKLISKESLQIIIVGILLAAVALGICIFKGWWLERHCMCGRNWHSPTSYPASYICGLLDERYRKNPVGLEKYIPLKPQSLFECFARETGKEMKPGIFFTTDIKKVKQGPYRFCIGWLQHPSDLPEQISIIYFDNDNGLHSSLNLGDDLRAWYATCIVQRINPYVKPDFFYR